MPQIAISFILGAITMLLLIQLMPLSKTTTTSSASNAVTWKTAFDKMHEAWKLAMTAANNWEGAYHNERRRNDPSYNAKHSNPNWKSPY